MAAAASCSGARASQENAYERRVTDIGTGDGNAVRQAGGKITSVRKEYYGLLRPEIIAMIPEECLSVLDVGCGTGVLGRHLKERGVAEVCGIELAHAAASEAMQVLDRVVEGDVERIEFPFLPEHFDCIVCADVLEHLLDPWTLTQKLSALLKPGGCIVASIPNVGFHRVVRGLIRGKWRYSDSGVLDKGHLRFFTWQGMQALFQESGFTVERVHRKIDSGLNMKLLNLLLCNRIREALVIQYVIRARKS
ncbi:MAG: class I SAM-dependent methyltransferase [Nitrospirae bacterium]|nr:class I SAM-dependent methyltransferase [Nitrospirota bacterium]